MKISYFILFIIFSSAGAETLPLCQKPVNYIEADIRNEMGPLRSQGGVGWCYGFTGADLMTHYMYKKGTISKVTSETMVSPLSVASKYNQNFMTGFSPVNELLKNEANKEKKILDEVRKKFKEKQERESKERSEKLAKIFNQFNPFESSEKKPEEVSKKAVIEKPKTNVIKPYNEGDLLPWNKVSKARDYAKNIIYSAVARKKIAEIYNKTGNLFEAHEIYLKYLHSLSASELASMGVDVVESGGQISFGIDSSKNSFCFEKELNSGDIGFERFDLKPILDSMYNMKNRNEVITCKRINIVHKMFPNESMIDILKALSASEKEMAYNILVNNNCKNKMSSNSSEPVVDGWVLPGGYIDNEVNITQAQQILMQRVEKIIEKGTPVGINYFCDFLNNEHAKKASPHASSIVGKKFNTSTCKEEYIVRNSFGTGCAYYQKNNPVYVKCLADASIESNEKKKNKLKSACDKNNAILYLNPKVRCDESSGYLFIEKDELAKNVYGATFLKE